MGTTFMARAGDIEREWFVVDAAGKPLGRLASAIASILRGKHKPIFTPHVDTGDHVIVINAARVVLTGKKTQTKMYYRHSRYPGGMHAVPAGRLLKLRPEFVVERAVRGMLPHNRLGRQMFKKLQVYRGGDHPHAAQKPRPLEL